MTERLTDASRALLEREGPLDEPTPDELEAHRVRAFAALGLPLPSNVAPPSSPTPGAESAGVPSAGAGAGLMPKLVAVALAVSSVAVIATWQSNQVRHANPRGNGRSAQHARAPAPVVEVAPTNAGPVGADLELPEGAPVSAPAPRATRAPEAAPPTATRPLPPNDAPAIATPVAAPSTAAPTAEDALAEQSMLVAAAEAQLRAGHATEALALFDRSLARHPAGTLRVESLAGRIVALCRLGRLDAGRGELTRFLDAYPRSPSAPRLRAACGVDE